MMIAFKASHAREFSKYIVSHIRAYLAYSFYYFNYSYMVPAGRSPYGSVMQSLLGPDILFALSEK